MQQGGDFIGQNNLGMVNLGVLKRGKAVAFIKRQLGVKLKEAAHIRIRGIAPELPELIGAAHISIKPDRTILGFAHLFAIGSFQKRRGEPKDTGICNAPAKVDTIDDIAPLIRSAHLQHTAIALVQFQKIIGLKDHIVKL